MFHNVLMTSLTPLRDTNENNCWDNSSLTTIWPGIKEDKSKDISIKKTIKKKKRNRTMFTTEQVRVLEKIFTRSKYIDVERRREIADCLQVEQKCIKIWFQNRRMKEKKEISENCDSTSETVVQSSSPPLEYSHPVQNVTDNDFTHTHVYSHVNHSPYYYAPNNYLKTDLIQNEVRANEIANNAMSTEYVNYNNDNINTNEFNRSHTGYSGPFYPPQTGFHYYYNTEDINNQNALRSNVPDWPVNIFDTSYF